MNLRDTETVYAGTTAAQAVYYGSELLWNAPGWEPPPFSPSSISGLRLWLDSSLGLYDATTGGSLVTTNSAAVRRWEDRSGNNFHATATSSSSAPTLFLNQVNARPALRFSGSQNFRLPVILNGSAATAFIVVTPSTEASNSGPLLGNMGSDSSSGHYPYQGGSIYDKFATTARKGPIAQPGGFFSWHLYAVSSAPSLWRYFFNGAVHFSTTSNSYASAYGSSAPTIGLDEAGGIYFFRGDIAEILVFNSALSADNLSAVSEYLRAKYNLF
jgi:hypothetical protein